ncbi:MAG: hypothetical protein ACM3W4_04325 [Ignavibacteriales bacterium]
MRITLGSVHFYIAVAPRTPVHHHPRTRRRVRVRRRHVVARMLCDHSFYYSKRRFRIVCVKCGSVRRIP